MALVNSTPRTVCHITTVDLMAYCFLRYRMEDLRRHGHRNVVVCQVTRFREPLERVADQVLNVDIPRNLRPWQDLKALFRLTRLLRQLKPDLVHTHSSKAGILGRLAARLAGVPAVVHTIHDLPQNFARRPMVKAVYRWLETLAAKWTDHLFTVSEINLQQILAERIAPRSKVSIAYQGLELERFQGLPPASQQRQAWGLPEGAEVVGMVARLEPAKDHPTLLRAFAQVARTRPRAYLVIVGQGHLEDQLRELAVQLGLEQRVLFTGWVENQLHAIQALDLLVLSTHYEGLGVVLLEALALAVPVISTRIGGTQEVIREGQTGLFVPPLDCQALAAAIESMLSHPGLARQMAEAGRADVTSRYLVERSNQEIYRVYQELWLSRPVQVDPNIKPPEA